MFNLWHVLLLPEEEGIKQIFLAQNKEWPGSNVPAQPPQRSSGITSISPVYTIYQDFRDTVNKEYFISKYYFLFTNKSTNKEKLKKAWLAKIKKKSVQKKTNKTVYNIKSFNG